MRPRYSFIEYTPPGRDSARVKAQAVTFLVGVRDLSRVTADELERRYRLKPATAADLLDRETKRRADAV